MHMDTCPKTINAEHKYVNVSNMSIDPTDSIGSVSYNIQAFQINHVMEKKAIEPFP